MKGYTIAWKSVAVMLILALIVAVIPVVVPTTQVFAQVKSLYVNKDLNANSPISAYAIQPAPTYLTWQKTSLPTKYGGAGLAIDTDSAILFVTFEGSGTMDIVDAGTLGILGTVSAPNASNLAGIVVDQDNQKVYAVDRNTDHLYVYSWNAVTKTLTNDITTSPYYITLPGITATGWHGDGAHGIALDEVNDLLYVCDVTTAVKVFNTGSWTSAGSVTVTQKAMGVAIDVPNQIVYTGNAYPGYGSLGLLCKYDLTTNTETTIDIQTLLDPPAVDNVVGLAVDHATGLVYITTGDQGSGGSDRIIVFDSSLNVLHTTGDIGNPTGIVVPGKPISYNPLNLAKTDGLADDACVSPGQNINYTISYDNQNLGDVTNVTITDTLPAEVSHVSGGTLSGNTVTWNIGTVTTGTSGSVTLTVQVKAGTPGGTIITNNCTLVSNETGPAFTDEDTDTCTNQPPDCSEAYAEPGCLWPPNHKFVDISIMGVTDPDGDPVTITITAITSDEATASDKGSGGAKHAPDASGVGTDTASVRAERSGKGDGRVYEISFTASDGIAECSGSVTVNVPHDQSAEGCPAVDSGQNNDATAIN